MAGVRVDLTWPGGEHTFALYLGELRQLQDACNAGPEEILNRLRAGNWKVDDLIEPLRLGLIGGGMPPQEAGPKVTNLIRQGSPLVEFKLVATAVVMAAIMGVEDDPLETAQTGESNPPATE